MNSKSGKGFLNAMAAKGRSHEGSHAAAEAFEFKVRARRNKLMALWVAERIAKDPVDVPAYVVDVIVSDLEEPGDEDVVRKLTADFRAHGIEVSRAEIDRQLQRCQADAEEQLSGG